VRPHYCGTGELLPRLFTLTLRLVRQRDVLRPRGGLAQGGIFSVTLSVAALRPRDVKRPSGGRQAPVVNGAPCSAEFGLSSRQHECQPAIARPTGMAGRGLAGRAVARPAL